jgi:hypothetical protein
MPINSSVFPALSCTSFNVLDLILRSLIHLELILVQGEGHGSSFSFLHANIRHFNETLGKLIYSNKKENKRKTKKAVWALS